MYSNFSFTNQQTFFQKLRSIDYLLLICILLVGSISCFAMYSTDGGEVLYHTKNHAIRFALFFTLMLVISFINIKMWFSLSYLFYGVTLILLLWASLYGITASGSQRWINLYFINLQPSELMKIAIIVCFAKYYHRAQIQSINKFTNIFIPIVILIIPIFLVITQPDLGTSILIALSGIMVLWLAGINIKYFVINTVQNRSWFWRIIWQGISKRYSRLSRIFTRKAYRFYIYLVLRRVWFFRIVTIINSLCHNHLQNN